MVKMKSILPCGDELDQQFKLHFNTVGIRQTRLMSRAVALCLSVSGMTAAQVSEGMSDLLDKEIRTSQVHKWSSEEDHANIPRADYLAALCEVTKQYFPIQVVAGALVEIKVTKKNEDVVKQNIAEAEKAKQELERYIQEQRKLIGEVS